MRTARREILSKELRKYVQLTAQKNRTAMAADNFSQVTTSEEGGL
jgi:hypothetical protein